MASVDEGSLIREMHTLAVDPPRDLIDLIYSNWVRVPGPIGDLYVAFNARGVQFIRTAESVHDSDEGFVQAFRARFGWPLRPAERPPAGLLTRLHGRHGSAVMADLRGLSEFELAVLAAAQRIPRGQTRPYAWVAHQLGRPRAVRAVGTALGKNPVPILIPCHRVTRSSGEPGEYVFGAELKQQLLRSEEVNLDEVRELARRSIFYIGSDTTGIVCYPTCASARRITQPHRRPFRTVDQAMAEGYRPCKQCTPVAQQVPA